MKIHFTSETCIEFILFLINHLWIISYMVTNSYDYLNTRTKSCTVIPLLSHFLLSYGVAGGWLMASKEEVSGTRQLAHFSSFWPMIGTSYILHAPALSKIREVPLCFLDNFTYTPYYQNSISTIKICKLNDYASALIHLVLFPRTFLKEETKWWNMSLNENPLSSCSPTVSISRDFLFYDYRTQLANLSLYLFNSRTHLQLVRIH